MSLWIESPSLVRADDGQTMFTFRDANWSLDSAEWQDAERVKMLLRCYPGDHTPSAFEVEIDCEAKQVAVVDEVFALESLEPYLEALYHRSQRKTQSAAPGRLASLVSRLRR